MKKFSKIVESNTDEKTYIVEAKVQIMIKAANDGEASYIADSSLSSIKYQCEYTIESIKENNSDSEANI